MTEGMPGASISRDAGPTYSTGETATFDICLSDRLDEAHVCLSVDGYRVLLQQPLQVNGSTSISGVLEEPGVLRCRVNWMRDGERHSVLCAAAYDPLEIQPTTTEPKDFDAFWQAQKDALAEVPLDARSQSASGDETNAGCGKLSLANIDDTRVYGYLASPPGGGPFPAILTLQNHGGGAWSVPTTWATSFAERGFISLAINTHDVDNGLGQAHYDRSGYHIGAGREWSPESRRKRSRVRTVRAGFGSDSLRYAGVVMWRVEQMSRLRNHGGRLRVFPGSRALHPASPFFEISGSRPGRRQIRLPLLVFDDSENYALPTPG